MKNIIKRGQVWKNCKNKDLWAIYSRGNGTVCIVQVKGEREFRTLLTNNFLNKYSYDTTYYLLYGEYDSWYD